MRFIRSIVVALLLIGGIWLLFGQDVLTPIGYASVHAATTSSTHFQQKTPSSCAQLTPQTDLKQLSDAQLLSFGLPTHVSLDHNLAYWQHVTSLAPRHI